MTMLTASGLDLLWLEVTGKCNLKCVHCYADSGPTGSHGAMTTERWLEVIEEAGKLGVKNLIFIGGEPTLHPDIQLLLSVASEHVSNVELYTNLLRLPVALLTLCQERHIDIATSFYSRNPEVHDQVTVFPSQRRVRRNIERALNADINVRVGVIEVFEGQEIEATAEELTALGVSSITIDRKRGVGRGQGSCAEQGELIDELCGHCSRQFAAVMPSGDVTPCVFSRSLTVGNVLEQSLAEVVTGSRILTTRGLLARAFGQAGGGSTEGKIDPSGVCPPRCAPPDKKSVPEPQVCPPRCAPPDKKSVPEPQVCPPRCAPPDKKSVPDEPVDVVKKSEFAPGSRIFVGASPIQGRGVFAAAPFAPGDLVERCPVVVISSEQVQHLAQTDLKATYFDWGCGATAIALGYGSLYNHARIPNARYILNLEEQSISFVATRPIQSYEEITINYSGVSDGSREHWLDSLRVGESNSTARERM